MNSLLSPKSSMSRRMKLYTHWDTLRRPPAPLPDKPLQLPRDEARSTVPALPSPSSIQELISITHSFQQHPLVSSQTLISLEKTVPTILTDTARSWRRPQPVAQAQALTTPESHQALLSLTFAC